jgi:hypothetical protein
MPSSKRDQESEKVLRQLRRWRRESLSWFGGILEHPTRALAQMLVIATLLLWLLFFVFGIWAFRQPLIIIAPLYAFYPGALVSDKAEANPASMYAWGIGAGIVFLALAVIGLWRRNRLSAILLMALFLVSTAICIARIFAELHSLHQ